MRDETLGVGDVGKMTDPQDRLSERDSGKGQQECGREYRTAEGCGPLRPYLGGFGFSSDINLRSQALLVCNEQQKGAEPSGINYLLRP